MTDPGHDPERYYHCDCLEGGYSPPSEREKELIDIIRLYSDRIDCPVCYANNNIIDQKVEKRGRLIAHSGGRWHTEHEEDCKIGKMLHKND